MRNIWLVLLTLAVMMIGLPANASSRDFVLTDTNGRAHRLSHYRGKWLIVNFWATWCPPCLEEIPDLVALKEARKDVQILGVAMEFQDSKQVLQFAEGMFVNYPIILGSNQDADQVGSVPGLPTTFFFNPKGRLVKRQVGKITRKQIDELMADKDSRAEQSAQFVPR
ncbi:MAG: TlpA disulfide reductase family protein [Burkholderiales bacterium]